MKANGLREGEQSPIRRKAKGRQFKGMWRVARKSNGRRFKGMRRVAGKSNGRWFEGMQRVAVELNRRWLALNGASSGTVWASSMTAKLNCDGGSSTAPLSLIAMVRLFGSLFFFFFLTEIWLWREFQLFRYSALLKKKL